MTHPLQERMATLERFLAQDPHNPHLLLDLAEAYAKGGRLCSGVAGFDSAQPAGDSAPGVAGFGSAQPAGDSVP